MIFFRRFQVGFNPQTDCDLDGPKYARIAQLQKSVSIIFRIAAIWQGRGEQHIVH